MKIRQQMVYYFGLGFPLLLGVCLVSVYLVFENYRKIEFYQRLEDRTYTTYNLLVNVEEVDQNILRIFDRNTINNLYQEKMLLFDRDGKLIYASLDDTPIPYSSSIIEQLKQGDDNLRMTDGQFEVFAHRFDAGDKEIFAIAKAYDQFGKSKLRFLRILLSVTFFVGAALSILMLLFLSRKISKPLDDLAAQVGGLDLDHLDQRITSASDTKEIVALADKFNAVIVKLRMGIKFQKNFIQLTSHELKTPIARLVSAVEREETEPGNTGITDFLKEQKEGLMNLANIINALQLITRFDSGADRVNFKSVNLFEVLMEAIDEVTKAFPHIHFNFKLDDGFESSGDTLIAGNDEMLKMVFVNLLRNAAQYAADPKVEVFFFRSGGRMNIQISNDGPLLNEDEQRNLFKNFFRGRNARHVQGAGLGLGLSSLIADLHSAHIKYFVLQEKLNCFTVSFPKPDRKMEGL